MQTYFDYFLEIAHFPLHITLYINAREKVRQKENRGMKKRVQQYKMKSRNARKIAKKVLGTIYLLTLRTEIQLSHLDN